MKKHEIQEILDTLKVAAVEEGIKIDPAIKERWVTALRSGEYEQAKHYLKCDGGYCCLGVLATVEGAKTTGTRLTSDGHEVTAFEFAEDGYRHRSTLPSGQYGIHDIVQGNLAKLNDAYDFTFEDIANLIEEIL